MSYYVSFGITERSFRDAFKRIIGDDIDDRKLFAGFTVIVPDKSIVWIWTKDKDIPNLAHEVFHAVDLAMDNRGVRLNDGSDEVYAYQISMLMRKILKTGYQG